jgi:hypothetical protein
MYFRGSIWNESNEGHRLGGGQPSPSWGYLPVLAMYNDNSGSYSLTHVINPTLVHEFTVSAHHASEASPPLHPEDLDRLNRSKYGLTLPQFYPQFNPTTWSPGPLIAGFRARRR